MKRLWTILIIAVLVAATIPAFAQKIERETNDGSQIVHLKTALNHLTVIELREPVIQVATGSQSFKVEWRENKVFVQPTEADASTNLFIWTASQRLNYELEPAGAVISMDFAVDQIPVPVVQPKPASVAPPPPSPSEVLLAGKPVKLESARPTKKPVEVVIRDLYEGDGRVLVRYAVRNRGTHAYDVTNAPGIRVKRSALPAVPLRPSGFAIGGPRSGTLDDQARNSGPSSRRARAVFSSCAGPGINGCGRSTPAGEHRANGVAFSICQ